MAQNVVTAEVSDVRRVESATGIPDGDYQGVLSGYRVSFETSHGSYEGHCEKGIRGTTACMVKVRNGACTVEYT